jgi:small-conductance mechanosensitive channel
MFLSLLAVLLLAALRIWAAPEILATVPEPYDAGLVHAIGIALTIAMAFFFDRVIRYFYWDGYLRRKRKRETPALIEDMMTVALVALGASIGLSIEIGVSFTGVITASGATAIVLGIALQAIIQDLFSGLSINFDGSYAIGDWLTIYSDQFREPVYGQVTGITWRITFLKLDDGRRVMIPNRLVTSHPVMNHSRPPGPKRLSFEVVVDVRCPAERVKAVLLDETIRAVRQKGLSATPEPDVLITKIAPDAVSYEVRFYADPDKIPPNRARSLVGNALHEAMLRHELPLPVSQVEQVHGRGAQPKVG